MAIKTLSVSSEGNALTDFWVGNNVRLTADEEGGNLTLISANKDKWMELDTWNEVSRLYLGDSTSNRAERARLEFHQYRLNPNQTNSFEVFKGLKGGFAVIDNRIKDVLTDLTYYNNFDINNTTTEERFHSYLRYNPLNNTLSGVIFLTNHSDDLLFNQQPFAELPDYVPEYIGMVGTYPMAFRTNGTIGCGIRQYNRTLYCTCSENTNVCFKYGEVIIYIQYPENLAYNTYPY